MENSRQGADVLFLLLGAVMVLAMHAGFAFLELGTVRKKNQVNALVKILVDFAVSTVAYFFVGYLVAYGTSFFVDAQHLALRNGYELVRFFFLMTFAAAVPAIVSGGIAERARFEPQLAATAVIVGPGLSVARRRRLERPLRRAGGVEGLVRRAVPRLRRQRRRARDGRLGGAGGGAAAGAARQPLSQGRRDQRASAVQHPVPGARRVGAGGGLVRLQRDERAGAGQDLGPGGRQLADGHGGRHAGGGA